MTQRWPFRVVVLFSGGETPGMNAFLRNFVRLAANRHGALVLGAKDGFAGLVELARPAHSFEARVSRIEEEIAGYPGRAGLHRASQKLVLMDQGSVSGLLSRGGIALGAARSLEFYDAETRYRVIELLWNLGVRAVLVCGGDGSLAAAARLASEAELRVVGIPATINNDVPMTDMALGVDTAANTLMAAAGNLAGTAVNQHRITVFEVMGRNSGDLARMVALASGAEIVVTPERGALSLEKVQGIAARLERAMLRGRRHAIVLVTEGVQLDSQLAGQGDPNPTMRLARELEAHFRRPGSPFPGALAHACVLGAVQRGGAASVADRILAARFAEAAWEAIRSPKERSGVLGLRNGAMLLQDFEVPIDPERFESAQKLYQLQKDVSRV
jgi:6-phosphofructokinase 1